MLLLITAALARPPGPDDACWDTKAGLDYVVSPRRYEKTWHTVSNVMLGTSALAMVAAGPGLDLWGPAQADPTARTTAVFLGGVIGLTPPMMAKEKICRKRPYMHVGRLPGAGNDDYASFFSGHTAIAGFGSFSLVSNLYIELDHDPVVRDVGYPLAALWTGTMGAMRMAAGKHYLSDVLLGGASGALAGALVPLAIDQTRAPGSTTAPLVFEVGGAW